jgi:hypothetical protein
LFIVWYTNYPIMIIFSIWKLTGNVISNSFHLVQVVVVAMHRWHWHMAMALLNLVQSLFLSL